MITLIRVEREFSVIETYINPEAIDAFYQGTKPKMHWNILLRSGISYDISDAMYKKLINLIAIE